MTKQNKIDAIYKEIATDGHKLVLIGDVLDYIDFNEVSIHDILYIWDYKRKPIEDQSEEYIDFVYNLIK